MRQIEVSLGGRSYPVLVGAGVMAETASWRTFLADAPLFVVTGETVASLYLDDLKQALAGYHLQEIILPDGETAKNFDNWRRIIDFLAHLGAGRDSILLALGGGVIGDTCGFAAATWMRGIGLIQLPTTLLAQVDAAVGGKTAINIPAGKNLVGAFHQPRAVVADTSTLNTLPGREYRAGLAEVVKYGAILDDEFLGRLENLVEDLTGRAPAALEEVVAASVTYKADVVARDELESGQRAILNFGHSFGHALEALTAYETFLHGEAVAIGMVIAARLSELRDLCEEGCSTRLAQLLDALGLPTSMPRDIGSDAMLDTMLLDKKNRSGRRRLVLLEAPGRAIIDESSPDSLIREAIELCR